MVLGLPHLAEFGIVPGTNDAKNFLEPHKPLLQIGWKIIKGGDGWHGRVEGIVV